MRPHDGKRRRALGLVLLFGVTFLPNNVAVAGDDPVQVDIDADGTTVLEDELHGVWQAMHEENPEDPPDRIEIFVRELGGDDEEEHEGCKVAHSGGGENGDGGNGDDGQLALPARGPALLWCTLYAMPGYVNTISPTTEVVVFIAGGHWLLPKPLPVIIRDVTVVGSNVPGDHDEFLFKALHAPEPDNSAVHHFDGGGSRGRDRRHAHARHHDARPNPRTSFDEDMQKQGKGIKYILTTVLDGRDASQIMSFSHGINVKLENLCFKGGAADRGAAVYVKESPSQAHGRGLADEEDVETSEGGASDKDETDGGGGGGNGGDGSRDEMGRKSGLGHLDVINCDFIHNTAEYGGAIYAGGTHLKVDLSSFTGNMAGACGGGVYSVEGNALTVHRSRFHYCRDNCGRRMMAQAHNRALPNPARPTLPGASGGGWGGHALGPPAGDGSVAAPGGRHGPQQVDASGALSIGYALDQSTDHDGDFGWGPYLEE